MEFLNWTHSLEAARANPEALLPNSPGRSPKRLPYQRIERTYRCSCSYFPEGGYWGLIGGVISTRAAPARRRPRSVAAPKAEYKCKAQPTRTSHIALSFASASSVAVLCAVDCVTSFAVWIHPDFALAIENH